MNYVLVLRAELVCLIILLYLSLVSGFYKMGKDVRIFNQLQTFAILHVIMDGVTVWTVNHTETVPVFWNNLAHIIFYLAAILFSFTICLYTLNMARARKLSRKAVFLMIAPVWIYLGLVAAGVLKIEYIQLTGTKSSAGTAPLAGYGLALVYFIVGIADILIRWNRIGKHFKKIMLPVLFLLILFELIQTQIKEFLFTGCAVTIVTVAFFFTLENPAAALKRKVMMDALSGLGTRSGYEHDMTEYNREFMKDRNTRFTFLFADINNLKSVNGLYGHQEGDNCISSVSVLLMTNLRNAEHIYRMGGEEFLAIYRKVDEKTVVRDIRRVKEACAREKENLKYIPELAIGYAVSEPQYNSLRDVLRVADYMMYRNKADIRLEVVEDAMRPVGTHLNLSGLTDRVFDAMCLISEEYYPYLSNMETGVTRVAPAMKEYFGLEGEFLNDFSSVWLEHVHPDDRQEYVTDLSATFAGRKQYHFCRYRARAKNGEYVQVTCRGGVYHGREGEPDVFAGYLVNHGAANTVDSSTGLKNYQAMYKHMAEAIAAGRPGVVMRLEIRNLNRIRMLYGGETGASLIRNLSGDFAGALEQGSEVYSNNGSDFAFCLREYDRARAEELFRRLRKHCGSGILTDDEMIPVDITGGAVVLPEETLDTPGMIRQAALYALEEARFRNPEKLWFFGETGPESGNENRKLLRTIQHDCVMNRSRFFLRFQPIIRAADGTVCSAEALLRWKSEEHGEVAPGRFIAFLENDPAYEPLGYEIIREAVRIAGRIRKSLPDFRISVNITAIQLMAEDFIPNVLRILEEERYAPSFLVLELTERCKELEFGMLNQRVEELKKAGIRVALDDMGTGYSTIDLLLHLSADEIKLDMTFTRELQGMEKHEIMTRTLCEASARYGTDICFEGVETEEMAEYLRTYGNVLLQGYYFDRPLLAEDFEKKYCGGTEN